MNEHAGFRVDVQGLRAVAVSLVLLAHANVPGAAGGIVGVDVFFVISGFLITGQLARALDQHGRIPFAAFYARRAQRILPAALVVILLTAAGALIWVTPVRLGEVLRHGVAAALSVPNVLFALEGTDYLAETVPSPFRQYWSLGVEEQFYLVWPVAMLGLFVLARRRRSGVVVGLSAIVVVSFAACVIETTRSEPFAFFLLPFRAWELGVGGLLAMTPLLRIPPAARVALGWAGLLLIGLSALTAGDADYPGAAAALPVLGAAGVVAGRDVRGGAVAVLGLRPLQFLGAISYPLYLVHWPILMLPREAMQWQAPLPHRLDLALAVAAVPVAWLLHRLVERPGRRIRLPPRRALIGAAAVTGIAVAALGGTAAAASRPVLASPRAVIDQGLLVHPAGTAFVPDDMNPTLRDGFGERGELNRLGCQQSQTGTAVLRCDFGDTTSPVRVALFGDSHAARLFPAFRGAAELGGFHLVTFIRSSCRSIDGDARWARPRTATCGAWRVAALAAIAADPPDVIVLANHTSSERGQAPSTPWSAMVHQSLVRLPPTSRVLLVADTPELTTSPLYCLAAHLDSARFCGVRTGRAFDPASAGALRAAVDHDRVGLIDLNPYLCNARRCPAVIGTTLVYTDSHHLTDEFAARLATPLARELDPVLRTLAPSPAASGAVIGLDRRDDLR